MGANRRAQVKVRVSAVEGAAFERVAGALGVPVSGAVRQLVLAKDRELAREGSERSYTANGANNVARDASGKSG